MTCPPLVVDLVVLVVADVVVRVCVVFDRLVAVVVVAGKEIWERVLEQEERCSQWMLKW